MSAVLDEQTQYVDSAGAPLVAGKIYIGTQNADPVANPITIFSDRDLTIAITNPQTLDADGRATNKIWIPGRYSLRIDDVNDVQQFQELDNGEEAASGITSLTNVSGADTITATAVTTITAYTDKELYTFRTAGANTGAVTLNIDGVGGTSVVKNHDQPIRKGDFAADQNVIVSRNETDDVFEWVNQNATIVSFYEGAAVVAAATTDIWSQGGQTVHVTGATGITSFDTAPQAGSVRWVIFDGAPLITNSANLNLPGGVDFQAAAGDLLRIYADTTTQFDVLVFPVTGPAVPRSYGAGCTLSPDSGDTDHDVNVTAGAWRDSTNSRNIVLPAEITKMLGPSSAQWVVGDNNGGLDGSESVAGTPDADTTYHVFVILRSDTGVVDVVASENISPARPTNYDFHRRIGSVITDSSANIIAFSQVGDRFILDNPPLDVDTANQGTGAQTPAMTTPGGIKTIGIFNCLGSSSTAGNSHLYVSAIDETADEVPSETAAPLGFITQGSGGNFASGQNVEVITNTSSQIRTRIAVSSTNDDVRIATVGWIDRRGRDE